MLCHDHLVAVNGNLSAKQNDVIISNLFFGPKSQCVDQGGGDCYQEERSHLIQRLSVLLVRCKGAHFGNCILNNEYADIDAEE